MSNRRYVSRYLTCFAIDSNSFRLCIIKRAGVRKLSDHLTYCLRVLGLENERDQQEQSFAGQVMVLCKGVKFAQGSGNHQILSYELLTPMLATWSEGAVLQA
jgi:hypothetical protein